MLAARFGRYARSGVSVARRMNSTAATSSAAAAARPGPPPPKAALARPALGLQTRPKPTKKELVAPRSKAQAAASPHGWLSYRAHKILQWKLRRRKHRLAKHVGRLRKKRPHISAARPRHWNRVLQPGVIPAYDEALKLLQSDSRKLLKQVAQQKAAIAKLEQDPEHDEATLEEMRKKLRILEVQSEINLPGVRWSVRNSMIDMAKPSHRHLFEQRWRTEGKLDMLMERVHQMNVVPDILPILHPSIDLHVTLRWPRSVLRRKTNSNRFYHPGGFIKPEQTLTPPTLYGNVFHTDTRLYTLLMVDPDVPDDEHSFTSYLHWMKPNIPLSSASRDKLLNLNDHTTYVPPHPQKGTPYHRYTILLLPQPPKTDYSLNTEARALRDGTCTSKELNVPVVPDSERKGFDVRAFIREHGLNPAKGGGVYMFRQVWDETVSKIYEDTLRIPEPRYGMEKRPDYYAGLKDRKKYI